MTIGLCVDVVDIGLANTFAVYKTMHPYVRTHRIATRTTRGGLCPNYLSSSCMTFLFTADDVM